MSKFHYEINKSLEIHKIVRPASRKSYLRINKKRLIEKMGGGGGMGGMTTGGTGAGVITVGMGSYPKRRKKKKINKAIGKPYSQQPGRRPGRGAGFLASEAQSEVGPGKAPSPLTEDQIMQVFANLSGQLSPENLACDGECSRAEVGRRYRAIMTTWHEMERKLGRKMSEGEVLQYSMKKYNERRGGE